MSTLDSIDKRIIQLLQENSRRSIADITREIGELTENAIRNRVEKLESEGLISHYTIRLNLKKFGKNISAIFDLKVHPKNLNKSLERLQSIEYMSEIYLTTGEYPIRAIGYFDDLEHLQQFVTHRLEGFNLIDYRVNIVINRYKHKLFTI